jgi:UDP-N-acetylglucosamine acyltransferase
MRIDPTATVENGASIGTNVQVGPHAYIGDEVTIGDDCIIGHGCHIEGRVTMGRNNLLAPYVVLGTPPQDLKWHGQKTELIIGEDNVFREFVTVNIGTPTGTGATRIGNGSFLMMFSHVAHDCVLEDEVILTNAVLLGGHCCVEKGANIAGSAAIHPFVTIGKRSYVGGLSRIVRDVPPFMTVEGNPARPRRINEIGLQRAGYDQSVIEELKRAFKAIFRTKLLNRSRIYESIEQRPDVTPETLYLLEFLRRSSKGVLGRYRECLRKG